MDYIPEEYERGRREAEIDAAHGLRKFYAQTRGAWGRFLTDLMRDRYRIVVVHTSDIAWPAICSYQSGYNSVTLEFLDTVCGQGEWDRIWAEVTEFRIESYRRYYENLPDEEVPEYYRKSRKRD